MAILVISEVLRLHILADWLISNSTLFTNKKSDFFLM